MYMYYLYLAVLAAGALPPLAVRAAHQLRRGERACGTALLMSLCVMAAVYCGLIVA